MKFDWILVTNPRLCGKDFGHFLLQTKLRNLIPSWHNLHCNTWTPEILNHFQKSKYWKFCVEQIVFLGKYCFHYYFKIFVPSKSRRNLTIRDFPISFRPDLLVGLSSADKGHNQWEKWEIWRKLNLWVFSNLRRRETWKTSFQRREMRRLIAAFEGEGVESRDVLFVVLK